MLEEFSILDYSSLVVGKFRLVKLEELACEWETELVLGCGAKQFVEIKYAGCIPFLYSVTSEKALSFLKGFKEGDAVLAPRGGEGEEEGFFRFAVATHLFVCGKGADTTTTTTSNLPSEDGLGFSVLPRDLFVPVPQMTALQRYFKEMRKWMSAFNSGGSYNQSRSNHGTRIADGEDTSLRDEPVLRYLNIALTEFVQQRLLKNKECVVNSAGHAVAVFIEHGQGFEPHTDSSPPFDLTLDLVVDHTGNDHRPISVCHADGSESIIKLSLGESVIFRGGELSHFGHSLPKGNTHTVALLTWTFCRD